MPGIDADAIIAAAHDPETEARLRAGPDEARTRRGRPDRVPGQVTPTPTAACASPRRASSSATARLTLEAGGFQTFEVYDVMVANLDTSLTRRAPADGRRRGPRRVPGRPDDRRGRADHGRGQVPARPDQAEDALITAVGDGRARRVQFGHDALWVPAEPRAALAAAA